MRTLSHIVQSQSTPSSQRKACTNRVRVAEFRHAGALQASARLSDEHKVSLQSANLGHDGFEELLVGLIVDAVVQGDVERVVLARQVPDVLQMPRAWEIIPKLVEGHLRHSPALSQPASRPGASRVQGCCTNWRISPPGASFTHRHHAISGIERLLHAVPVVDVNVEVEHAAVVLEQLQDGQHDVVHVTESRRLGLRSIQQDQLSESRKS